MNRHVNITVIGKVQGVFFRVSTKQAAENLGICGQVCNLKNGDVYIEAEGEELAINRFMEWCSNGPSGAEVQHLDAIDGSWQGFSGFEIVR